MQNAAQHSVEAITIGVSNKATIAGGATAFVAGAADKVGVGSVDLSSWCAVGGLALAALGFLVSVYFQWRKDLREERIATASEKFGIVQRVKIDEPR